MRIRLASVSILAPLMVAACHRRIGTERIRGDEPGSSSSAKHAMLGKPLDVRMVSAGTTHSCAVLTDGGARCWGLNEYGKLGDGTAENHRSPIPVLLASPTRISAGYKTTCALSSLGAVSCWGYNANGEAGTGVATPPFSPILSPTAVKGPSDVVQLELADGGSFGCLRTKAGAVSCWGSNSAGQLGVGDTVARATPTAVAMPPVSAIAVGFHHACAVTVGGEVACWGDSAGGALGNGLISSGVFSTPTLLTGVHSAVSAAAGGGHSCVVLSDGTMRCWGEGRRGALGNGETGKSARRGWPVVVSAMNGAVEVGAGEGFTCARMTDGTVRCWGANSRGQLGDSTLVDRALPGPAVAGVSGAVSLSVGLDFACAVMTAGVAKCWGAGDGGKRGDGAVSDSATATTVVGN